MAAETARKIAVKTRLSAAPVTTFMGKRPVKTFGIAESLERRHLDTIRPRRIKGAVAAMLDNAACSLEICFRPLDALHGVELGRCRRREVSRQAVDLLGIKNRVA